MNNDSFFTEIITDRASRPLIPQEAYRPAKRCPKCDSVFLSDSQCEACGLSLSYHPVGEPFSAKSLYGMKERHYQKLPYFVRLFPVLENRDDQKAKSYRRHLNKRLVDLLSALGAESAGVDSNRRFFYVELLELMDELLRYGENALLIQNKIEEQLGFSGSLLTAELLTYLETSDVQLKAERNIHWSERLLEHRLLGVISVDKFLKSVILSATVIAMAVSYFDIIRSQFGK